MLLPVLIRRGAGLLDEEVVHVLGGGKAQVIRDLADIAVGVEQHINDPLDPPLPQPIADAFIGFGALPMRSLAKFEPGQGQVLSGLGFPGWLSAIEFLAFIDLVPDMLVELPGGVRSDFFADRGAENLGAARTVTGRHRYLGRALLTAQISIAPITSGSTTRTPGNPAFSSSASCASSGNVL